VDWGIEEVDSGIEEVDLRTNKERKGWGITRKDQAAGIASGGGQCQLYRRLPLMMEGSSAHAEMHI
jgi:hypothetical protein